MNLEILEKALRKRYRFPASETGGLITLEDLYQLPLKGRKINLNDVAKALSRKLKESTEEDFVSERTSVDEDLANQFEIVKYIIDIRKKELKEATEAAAKAAKKQEILELINKIDSKEMENKSKDELLKLYNEI